MERKNSEPKIIVFACEWCPYIGADNAGTSRNHYPANVRILKTVCAGQVTPAFILESFYHGADGVLVTGCEFGQCHYIRGNEGCAKVIDEARRILDAMGIAPERLGLELFPDVAGGAFAKAMRDFTDKIGAMGKISPEVAA